MKALIPAGDFGCCQLSITLYNSQVKEVEYVSRIALKKESAIDLPGTVYRGGGDLSALVPKRAGRDSR